MNHDKNKKTMSHVMAAVLAALVCALVARQAGAGSTPLGSAFTYQGELKLGGTLVNGTADFQITLFDALSGPTQIGSMVPVNNVTLVAGRFTAPLDFGPAAFDGNDRYLQIAVRSPAGSGSFTTLTPRQKLTAAPFALYALSGPGSGGPWAVNGNNISNTNTGNVGIGISSPGAKLDVQASNNSNVLFGRRAGGGLAHNLYIDFAGNGSMQLIDSSGTPRVEFANGLMYLNYGNVGIGTAAPAAKLDVRGDIRLGPTGQFRAAAGEENLRIIRGTIAANGSILAGAGSFTVNHSLLGVYVIIFNTPFAATPTVTATFQHGGQSRTVTIFINGPPGPDFVNIKIDSNDSDHEDINPTDRDFHFIAIGPR